MKQSLAYIQLEKQNERLKEALIRLGKFVSSIGMFLIISLCSLRDITQETDQEQRRRISEMEKDSAEFEELQCRCHICLVSAV